MLKNRSIAIISRVRIETITDISKINGMSLQIIEPNKPPINHLLGKEHLLHLSRQTDRGKKDVRNCHVQNEKVNGCS